VTDPVTETHCAHCGKPVGQDGVWVLSRDDGNVCCPGEEWVSIHITQESAEAAKLISIAEQPDKRWSGDAYYVKHWPVTPRTIEP